VPDVYLALICVEGREICCLQYAQLTTLVAARRNARGADESQYTVLVKMPFRREFRVYVNEPGRKNIMLGEVLVPRRAFPDRLFS